MTLESQHQEQLDKSGYKNSNTFNPKITYVKKWSQAPGMCIFNIILTVHRDKIYNRTNEMHFLINLLNTKRRLLYLKAQFVPSSKNFSSRL